MLPSFFLSRGYFLRATARRVDKGRIGETQFRPVEVGVMITLSHLRRMAVIASHAKDEVVGRGGPLAKVANTDVSTYVTFVAVDELCMCYDGGKTSCPEQVSARQAARRADQCSLCRGISRISCGSVDVGLLETA
jgi:hypothetical protein